MRPWRRRPRLSPARQAALTTLAAIAGALALGCSDEPTEPRAPTPGGGPGAHPAFSIGGAAATLPPRTSNSVKYRTAGRKPGTGRSGAATLTARALLGKNGDTYFEVTTGQLDNGSTTAPGNLDKVQEKELERGGTVINTSNFNKLSNGGYWTYQIKALTRGDMVQVQANVSGIDPTRTDVVTVRDTVKLRPDLVAAELSAPNSAPLRAPVEIAATVFESNGDVGARADCVLYVDGAEADRARGIWVDAGDQVTCAFTKVFDAVGTRQLKVVVEGVVPGDWDTQNNQVTGSIEIRSDVPQDFNYYAYADDVDYQHRYTASWSYRYTNPTGYLQLFQGTSTYQSEEGGRWQSSWHHGWMGREVPFPLQSLTVEHASNGTTLATQTFNSSPDGSPGIPAQWGYEDADPTNGYRYFCANQYVDGDGGRVFAQLCSGAYQRDGTWSGWSQVYHTRWAGRVTYLSKYFFQAHYEYADGTSADGIYYYWNNARQDVSGLPLPTLGPTYTMRLAVTGGDGATYQSTAEVPLEPYRPWWVRYGGYPNPYEPPRYCRSDTEPNWTNQACYEWYYYAAGREGWTSGAATGAATP